MGNIMAASSKPRKSETPLEKNKKVVPAPAAGDGFELVEVSEAANVDKKLENPGTVEEVHQKCTDLRAKTFEGAKIILNKGLSNHFQISHALNLHSSQRSSYRFCTTYVGTKQFSPSEAFPVLFGDIDPSGNLHATFIHQFSPRLRCKFSSRIQDSEMIASQLSTDYRGDDFTASFTVANPNFFQKSGVLVCHYLQSIAKGVALGAELAYQSDHNLPGGQIAVLSVVGRYTSGDSVWSGTLGPGSIQLCYYQKASEQLQIGVELETSLRMQESVASIGYQVDLPKADLIFKGSLDSKWVVRAVLEKRLRPMPLSFALSGRLNHTKDQFRLGCGLIIG